MNRIIKVIIGGISLLLLFSCQKAVMLLVGVKTPETENATSIQKFLIKIGSDSIDAYALDTTLFDQLRSKPFKPGWPPSLRPVQIRVYDKAGLPIMHWASCEGFLWKLKTFDTVPPRNQVNLDSTLNLEQDLSRYYTLDGKKPSVKIDFNYDYHIIVYFAKYFPKMSKQSFREVNRYIKNNPSYRFKVYKINVDALNWWNAELITDIQIKHH